MIYMEERHLEIVRNILKKYDYSFYAFGSRVKGTQKPLSDFDLVFMDNMKPGDKFNIDDDFEESDLPFKVDIVNYQTLSSGFKEIIRPDLEVFKISTRHVPHPDVAYPLFNDVNGFAYKECCFLKNIIKNTKYINVGDYTYYADILGVDNFERNVLYHYDFIGDKLIIGKFCQIAQGVKFIMNGSQHSMSGISTYPFKTFSGSLFGTDKLNDKLLWDIPFDVETKGDTIVGNDVWIGYNATIMPGVKIGDGAIIAANSTVTKNVEPYAIVGGNPATLIRKRFDDQTIEKLLKLKWWDMEVEKLNEHIKDIGLDIKKSKLI